MQQTVADRAPLPQRKSEKAAAAAPAPAAAAPAQDEEQPPAAARKQVDLRGARQIVAKFDQPCASCGVMIKTGTDAAYIGDGPAKGRYCLGGCPPNA